MEAARCWVFRFFHQFRSFSGLRKIKAWRWKLKFKVKMVPKRHWERMRKQCLDEAVGSTPKTAQCLVATCPSNSTIHTQRMLMLGFLSKSWGRTPFGCTTEKRFGSSESSTRVTCNSDTVSASLPTHPSGSLLLIFSLCLNLTLMKFTFRKSIPLKVLLPLSFLF